MEKKIHTKKDAEYCLWYFKKHICKDAVLIGAFAKDKAESEHDIDIYLPNMFKKGFAKAPIGEDISFIIVSLEM